MNRRSDQYWVKRFAMIENAQHAATGKTAAKMAREIAKAEAEIDKDISRWFRRMADNNGISLVEARKLLNDSELEEFKWTVAEYIEAGRANGLQYDKKLAKMLENASARVHISRLEAAKYQMHMHAQRAFASEQVNMDELLQGAVHDTFWKSAYEIQRGVGVGWTLQHTPMERIDTLLSTPWASDGLTFSDRIWGNKGKLVASLETKLVQAVVRGQGASSFITELAKEMNVARYRAATLAHTEAAFFSSVAQGECYKELGVTRYRIVATLDHKTSTICQEMDGKVFLESERQPGVTAYPFHQNCRTGDAPYHEDMAGIGERAARDMDGKTYYVPRDMTYPEWLEKQKEEHGAGRVEAAQRENNTLH